jgi:hypothetical protein
MASSTGRRDPRFVGGRYLTNPILVVCVTASEIALYFTNNVILLPGEN